MNLYELLPTIYRRRDAELDEAEQRVLEGAEGEYGDAALANRNVTPLKALFAVLQSQYDLLEREIGALYDDWFVETCSPEMLEELAQPFAIADLDALMRGGADARAIVANIMRYRSAKGSAASFEAYARDATRWTVRVADRIASTAGTSRVDGGSALRRGYPDLRRGGSGDAPPRVTGAGVRHAIGPRSAEVEVYRVRAMHVTGATPGRPRSNGAGRASFGNRRTFSPVGDSKHLMRPVGTTGAGAVPYTRASAREALTPDGTIPGIEVSFANTVRLRLCVGDLSNWAQPPGPSRPLTAVVDPELGRLLTPTADDTAYTVEYWQAMNDGIGASPPSRPWSGEYDRTLLVAPQRAADAGTNRYAEARLITRVLEQPELIATLLQLPQHPGDPAGDGASRDVANKLRDVYFDEFAAHWAYIADHAATYGTPPNKREFSAKWPSFELVSTTRETAELIDDLAELRRPSSAEGDSFERVPSFGDALRAAESASGSVRIVLRGSGTHAAQSGGWTFRPQPWLTQLYVESAPGGRPTLASSLRVLPRRRRHEPPLAVELRGLNVGARIGCARDMALTIVSCTLRPVAFGGGAWSIGEAGTRSASAAAKNENATHFGTIRIVRSIVGGARLGRNTTLTVEDSIVTDPIAPELPDERGPKLAAMRSTFLARVDVEELTASDALFDAEVTVRTRSAGYARYCVARPDAELPLTYKCFRTARQLLASATYGHFRFARLRHDAPKEVRAGSSTGSEMGAYGTYAEAHRVANLHRAMEEYLPEGVTPHVVYRL
jgi:hypothetical protein